MEIIYIDGANENWAEITGLTSLWSGLSLYWTSLAGVDEASAGVIV